MEKKYKTKGNFELNINCVNEVVNIVANKNKEVKFRIKRSPNKYSKSIYIICEYKGYSSILRISDHYTNKESYYTILATENTTKSNICYKLQRTVENAKYKFKIKTLESFNEKENK